MGQSTPTTTMALDTFEARYAAFRSELAAREQEWFDELVRRARRHSNAINRRPHLDFERPVVLAMLLAGMREVEDLKAELSETRAEVETILHALAEAGLVVRRTPRRTPMELGRLGQSRLGDDGASRAQAIARIEDAHRSSP